VQTAQQDAEAARLRSAGVTYRDIAEALGICDASSARKCVERALLATVAEPAEELRRLELMKLDQLSVAARRRTGLERHRVGAASGSGPFPPGAHPLAVRWNTSGLGRSTADKRRHASVGSGIFRYPARDYPACRGPQRQSLSGLPGSKNLAGQRLYPKHPEMRNAPDP